MKDIKIEEVLKALQIEKLNVMQEQMLKTVPQGQDILLLSPTGSGKTLAFLLPLIKGNGSSSDPSKSPEGDLLFGSNGSSSSKTLILAPSRELAQQTADVWNRMHTGISCFLCYGGHNVKTEAAQLEILKNQEISEALIVATPGRLKDHIERGNIDISNVNGLIIDEYDKMLELGFEEEMKFLIDHMPNLKQRILTSATNAIEVAKWVGFKNDKVLDFGHDSKEEAPQVTYYQIKSPVADKLETLSDLLFTIKGQAIIFLNYRDAAERVANHLKSNGIQCALYHGGLLQEQREKAIIRLRHQSVKVLVSTDLASRGLDLPEVEHIIHYHIPQTAEVWTHRNGRTARAGAEGSSYIIYGPNEVTPDFVPNKLPYFHLQPNKEMYESAPYETIYIGRGKREKVSRGDVLGFFTKVGGLESKEIGRIDVMEHSAYIAIKREKVDKVLENVKGQKIKGMKTLYVKTK